jgi:hypothetical protein
VVFLYRRQRDNQEQQEQEVLGEGEKKTQFVPIWKKKDPTNQVVFLENSNAFVSVQIDISNL